MGGGHLVDALSTLPGVQARVARRVLGAAPWTTMIAEHHLDDAGAVDLMACAVDVWAALGPHRRAPPRALAGAPLFWAEWDLAAGRSDEAPLWSVCVEPELLTGPCAGPADAAAGRLRRRALELVAPASARAVEAAVAHLGDDGRLLHVAPLDPRARPGLRLSWWVRAGAAREWLSRVGHPSIPGDLGAVLFDLAPAAQHVGVQIEVIAGAVGRYLAIESPLIRQGRRPPSMHLRPWLAQVGAAGRASFADLTAWVAEPPTPAVQRQLYVKMTAGPAWFAKAYAGVTDAPPGPSTRPTARDR